MQISTVMVIVITVTTALATTASTERFGPKRVHGSILTHFTYACMYTLILI
jgi:hypothetical protein